MNLQLDNEGTDDTGDGDDDDDGADNWLMDSKNWETRGKWMMTR